jgi:hypothetical protein
LPCANVAVSTSFPVGGKRENLPSDLDGVQGLEPNGEQVKQVKKEVPANGAATAQTETVEAAETAELRAERNGTAEDGVEHLNQNGGAVRILMLVRHAQRNAACPVWC